MQLFSLLFGLVLLALASHVAKFGNVEVIRSALPIIMAMGGASFVMTFGLQRLANRPRVSETDPLTALKRSLRSPAITRIIPDVQDLSDAEIPKRIIARLVEFSERERLIAEYSESL